MADYSKPNSDIRVYGHVYDRLKEYQREEETLSEAIERLLPWEGEVLECAEYDSKVIAVGRPVHQELVATAGQNFAITDVIDQYLTEEGIEREPEQLRRVELKDVEN